VEQPNIPDLANEQIEALCDTAEQVARKLVLSTVSSKAVEELNIGIEAEGRKRLNLSVEVDTKPSTRSKTRIINRSRRARLSKPLKPVKER